MSRGCSAGGSGGFTITELVSSAVIVGFIFLATGIIYMMLNRVWMEDLVLSELISDANIAVERMVRGVRGNEGLLSAKNVTSPLSGASDNQVSYTDFNNVARSFYYSNGMIYATGHADPIISGVTSAVFSNINDMVRIELTTHKHVIDKEIRFSLRTQVKPRN